MTENLGVFFFFPTECLASRDALSVLDVDKVLDLIRLGIGRSVEGSVNLVNFDKSKRCGFLDNLVTGDFRLFIISPDNLVSSFLEIVGIDHVVNLQCSTGTNRDGVEVLVFLHSKKNSNIIVEIFSQVLFINKRIAVVTHNISGLDSCIELSVLRNDLSILLVNELIQGLAVECLSHNFSSLSDVNKSLVAPDVVHTAGFGLPHKVGQRSWVEVRRGWKANGEVIRGHFGRL